MKSKNTRVASEGRPKPVTPTRMFSKFLAFDVCSISIDWPFSDRRYLIAKVINFSEITTVSLAYQ